MSMGELALRSSELESCPDPTLPPAAEPRTVATAPCLGNTAELALMVRLWENSMKAELVPPLVHLAKGELDRTGLESSPWWWWEPARGPTL